MGRWDAVRFLKSGPTGDAVPVADARQQVLSGEGRETRAESLGRPSREAGLYRRKRPGVWGQRPQ